jgi:hypothetical protein
MPSAKFKGPIVNDWLHNLPIVWMALLVFGLTALGHGSEEDAQRWQQTWGDGFE